MLPVSLPTRRARMWQRFFPLSFAALFLFVGVTTAQEPVLSQLPITISKSSTSDYDCSSNTPLTETGNYHPLLPSSKSLADICTKWVAWGGSAHFRGSQVKCNGCFGAGADPRLYLGCFASWRPRLRPSHRSPCSPSSKGHRL